MKLPLVLSLLVPAVLASSAAHETLQRLAASSNGVVRLTGPLYDELVAAPRNYSASVLLTAMGSKFGCQPCRMFDPEYKAVARSWHKQGNKDIDHFFTVLDFEDAMDTFRKARNRLCLQSMFLANPRPVL
jgi:oligosaccharyltransferase complex subunit gamma